MARRPGRERELGILPRRKVERPAGLDREPQALDVVGQVVEGEHTAAHDPRRVHHQILGVDAPYHRIFPDLGAAREDDALGALLRRKRMLRMLELVHVAGTELALAGAAVACLAGKGECHPRPQQRLEDGVARLDGNRPVAAFESDLHAPSGRARMLAPRLLQSQIVWNPNKIGASSMAGCWPPACSPGCWATACALPSKRCSATSPRAWQSSRRGASASCC